MRFADAKPGDLVAIPYDDGDVKQAAIDKVTATQIVVGDRRYRRDTGCAVGDRRGCIVPWTEEHEQQRRRYATGRRLSSACRALETVATGWRVKLPADAEAAETLAAAIEAYVAAAGAQHGARGT